MIFLTNKLRIVFKSMCYFTGKKTTGPTSAAEVTWFPVNCRGASLSAGCSGLSRVSHYFKECIYIWMSSRETQHRFSFQQNFIWLVLMLLYVFPPSSHEQLLLFSSLKWHLRHSNMWTVPSACPRLAAASQWAARAWSSWSCRRWSRWATPRFWPRARQTPPTAGASDPGTRPASSAPRKRWCRRRRRNRPSRSRRTALDAHAKHQSHDNQEVAAAACI